MFSQFLLYLFIGASTFVATVIFLRGVAGHVIGRMFRRLFKRRPGTVFLRPYQPTKP